MSFLGRLFGEKTGPSKEVNAIFEKIHLITTTDSLQNSFMPGPLYKQMEANGGVDEIPSSFGNFGHAITNPIPVNGSLGEVLYLSNISTKSGHKVFSHRIGSAKNIDIFEIVSINGDFWDILYLNMYYIRKSRKVPTGYKFQNGDDILLLRSTAYYLPEFPNDFHSVLTNFSETILGMSIADKDAKLISNLIRPAEQISKLSDVEKIIKGRTVAPSF